ncbi:MAG: DUF3048 domain-containing protein [Ruminococcaceae bacterium]|nr:DUF3048 domain-containing protein [Oscillospiraceae bacterium]
MPNIIKLFIISLLLLSVILCSSCAIIEKRTEEFDTKDDFISETASDSESESESEEIPVVVIPEYINPLTGLGVSEDVANNRPVAVMINNIKASMPQLGTSGADVIYECIVEGAQTRLMAVYLDYADIGAIGSVRSSREYYLDFAGNHDAIYVHAGGSDEAYRQIKASRVNNLDGVNMYLPSTFYRDEARVKSMPYEHTLMTSGEGIVDGIDYKGYRSEANADFKGPFEFAEFGEEIIPEGDVAEYVSVSYSDKHEPYYIYNGENNLYERYQFNEIQEDASTCEGLKFDNIIILYCSTYNTGDEYGHYSVSATGKGDGVYVTRGKAVSIKWEKSARNNPVKLTLESGEELIINRGKTMMQICTNSMKDDTVISSNHAPSQNQQDAQADGITVY